MIKKMRKNSDDSLDEETESLIRIEQEKIEQCKKRIIELCLDAAMKQVLKEMHEEK